MTAPLRALLLLAVVALTVFGCERDGASSVRSSTIRNFKTGATGP